MMMKTPQIVSKEYFTQTRNLFHCHFKIKISCNYDAGLLDRCFDLLENIDQSYNSYQPKSYFSRINRQAGQWVEVNETCIQLLTTLKLISSLTNGSYDITCMPLIQLWGFYRTDNHTVPALSEIQRVLKQVDYRKIEIDGLRVRIAPDQEIITGSFVKAFAVDKVAAFLKEHGVTDAIINAGGSTMRALNDNTHPHWKVNIPNPFMEGVYSETLSMSNKSFSLSGKKNNHLVINNTIYGHILNSKTGLPTLTEQVGVLTESAFISDVVSTALHTVPREEVGMLADKLLKQFHFSYFRVEEDGSKTKSICF